MAPRVMTPPTGGQDIKWLATGEIVPAIGEVVLGIVDGFRYPVPVSIAFIGADNRPCWRIWPQTNKALPDTLFVDGVTYWLSYTALPQPPSQEEP